MPQAPSYILATPNVTVIATVIRYEMVLAFFHPVVSREYPEIFCFLRPLQPDVLHACLGNFPAGAARPFPHPGHACRLCFLDNDGINRSAYRRRGGYFGSQTIHADRIAAGSGIGFAVRSGADLLAAAAGELAVGIAITFISGADMAFFYDTLQEIGLESDYPRLRGHLSAVGLVAVGASSILGGLLATWQFSSPFLFYAGALAAAGLVVLMLKEPPGLASADGGKRLRYADILQGTFNAIRKIPALGYVLAYSNVLPLAGAAILITFIQPHAIAIGVPLASLGILSFGLTLFRILGSMRSGRFVRRFGEWRSLVMGAVLVVTGVFGLGAFPSMVGVGLFALAAYASAATRPLIEDLLLRQVPATIRATILSVDNLIFRVLLAFLELGAGIAADVYGLPAAFMLMAVVVGFILYFLLASWRRIWGKEIGPAGPDLVSA
jgi:hypothetical protein